MGKSEIEKVTPVGCEGDRRRSLQISIWPGLMFPRAQVRQLWDLRRKVHVGEIILEVNRLFRRIELKCAASRPDQIKAHI